MRDDKRGVSMKRLLLMCCIALSMTAVQSAMAQITAKGGNQWESFCAQGGLPPVCFLAALAYDKGEGVRQDKFKAVELYTKACDGGNADGCTNLGVMYVNGEGVKLDKKRALALYGKACDLKEERGCKNYAILKGQGH